MNDQLNLRVKNLFLNETTCLVPTWLKNERHELILFDLVKVS